MRAWENWHTRHTELLAERSMADEVGCYSLETPLVITRRRCAILEIKGVYERQRSIARVVSGELEVEKCGEDVLLACLAIEKYSRASLVKAVKWQKMRLKQGSNLARYHVLRPQRVRA